MLKIVTRVRNRFKNLDEETVGSPETSESSQESMNPQEKLRGLIQTASILAIGITLKTMATSNHYTHARPMPKIQHEKVKIDKPEIGSKTIQLEEAVHSMEKEKSDEPRSVHASSKEVVKSL